MKIKLRLDKRTISKDTEKNVLMLKHDRYLARVHTLISSALSFLIALGLFFIAGLVEGFFSFERNTIFIFSLIIAITIVVTTATYLHWKTVRIESVEDMIDICENNLSKKKPT